MARKKLRVTLCVNINKAEKILFFQAELTTRFGKKAYLLLALAEEEIVVFHNRRILLDAYIQHPTGKEEENEC